MREILFRGKTKMIAGTYNCGKEDGEWVIGCLYCDVGKWIIRQFEFDRADYVSYEVDPETVCQYTGLDDKNGRKIFEGDIVINKSKWNENIGIVKFLNARFMINWKLRNRYSDKGISCRTDDIFPGDEVIGNIFDNPELMGGAEK